jgi:hypothetical protein
VFFEFIIPAYRTIFTIEGTYAKPNHRIFLRDSQAKIFNNDGTFRFFPRAIVDCRSSKSIRRSSGRPGDGAVSL